MATYNKSTYQEIIDDLRDEFDSPELLSTIKDDSIKQYILQACQKITERIAVRTQRELRLLIDQVDYEFADSTVPVTGTGTLGVGANKTVTGVTATGTGTITTDGVDVTGSGTSFLTELAVGKALIVGTEIKSIRSITSATVLVLESGFDTDLTASAFDYSTTKFTKEVNVGSSIVVGGVTRIVDTITDAYNLTVTQAYAASQSAQTFTIDTVVSEIPTEFFGIYDCSRLEDTVERKVNIVDISEILKLKQEMLWFMPLPNWNQPYMIAEWLKENGRRYLKIYPEVDVDKQITLYGFLRINPRFHTSDALTAYIPLMQDFDPMIKDFTLAKINSRLPGRERQEIVSRNDFEIGVRSFNANKSIHTRVQVVTD